MSGEIAVLTSGEEVPRVFVALIKLQLEALLDVENAFHPRPFDRLHAFKILREILERPMRGTARTYVLTQDLGMPPRQEVIGLFESVRGYLGEMHPMVRAIFLASSKRIDGLWTLIDPVAYYK